MAELMEELAEGERRQTRRAWWFAGGALVFVLMILLLLVFKDAPPPDDEWMTPVFAEGGGRNNPLAVFCEQSLLLPEVELSPSSDASWGKRGAEKEMAEYLEKNEKLIALWQALMETDSKEWRWPISEDEVSYLTPTSYLSKCQTVGTKLGRMKVTLLTRENKVKEAAGQALKMMKFGLALKEAKGQVIHDLIAMTCHAESLYAMEKVVTVPGVDAAFLKDLQNSISNLEDASLEHFRFSLQLEYLGLKNALENPKILQGIQIAAREKLRYRFFLRKNQTLRLYLSVQRPILDSLDKGNLPLLEAARSQQDEFFQWSKPGWKKWLNPNAGGALCVESVISPLSRIYERAIATLAYHRMTTVMLALRQYELAEGMLPTTLQELVPLYIPSVPLDPFDEHPLRWNAAKARIYSVGADTKDDGGKFDQPFRYSSSGDIGLLYWWGEEGSKYREDKIDPSTPKKPSTSKNRKKALLKPTVDK